MATNIYLPKVGMTMEEGTLSKWLVPEGAAVTRGQPIFEMETEKVEMEIEAEADGILHHLAAEGAVLKPGDIVGALLAAGEAPPPAPSPGPLTQNAEPRPAAAAEPPVQPPQTATPAGRGPVRASPIARRLADENAIDVTTLTGSGPDGRIVERDVQRAIQARTANPSTEIAEPEPTVLPPLPAGRGGQGGEVSSYAGRRRTTGQRMFDSLSSMAQLTLVSEAPVDDALSMLHGLNREWRKDGVVVTLTGLIVRACALALTEHLSFNARLEGGQIVRVGEINVGVAVNQDQGLIVPVIRNADASSLEEVARRLHELVQSARAGQLQVDDVGGGSFTVTSLEGTVVDAFTPIINPPQAAILGVGRVREVAAFEGAEIVKRQVTTLSLTFDHRLNDGAPAAEFLGRVAELLSRPYMLM